MSNAFPPAAPGPDHIQPALLSEIRGTPPAPDRPAVSMASIPVEKKISFDAFMRIVWQASRTNLSYRDFCGTNSTALAGMFYPRAQ